jgi:hypothetical protein
MSPPSPSPAPVLNPDHATDRDADRMDEPLELEDMTASAGGGFPVRRRRHLAAREVWWVPDESCYHVDAGPLHSDHVAEHAVFGRLADAFKAGALEPCDTCAPLTAP